jgi:CRP/FNR family transcriptional regulator, cyclic AMP receptor protein
VTEAASVDRRAILARSEVLRHLSAAQLDLLAQRCSVRRVAAGETVFERGAPGSSLLGVISGRVKVSVLSTDGRELILNIIKPGEVFGEIALLDGGERTANASALAAGELLMLQRRDFLPLLEHDPGLGLRLIELLCRRLRVTSQQVEDMQFLDLSVRLARALLQLAETDGASVARGRRLNVKLSQSDLGTLIGASRERISRQLAIWQRDGLLSHEAGIVTIHRLDDLAGAAEGE